MPELPSRFCWTKYGTEAGEPADAILARKERERFENGGIFLWGIGNSIAPGIRALVKLEHRPLAVFSPMISSAKVADVNPSRVVRWTRARDMNGDWWPMPLASRVTSRGSTGHRDKTTHYALVCKSDQPLTSADARPSALAFDALSNLESGNRLGFSQVTSVVKMNGNCRNGRHYDIGFVAELAFPYFVELHSPVHGVNETVPRDRLTGYQPSLSWA